MLQDYDPATFGDLEYSVSPQFSYPIKSRLLEKSDNAILESSRRLTTFVIDKHKNRDTGNTSKRQFLGHCLQYVYSLDVSD